MSDIFISYSRIDISIATKLMQRLQAEGWCVFIDKQTHVGRRWHQEIEKELHAAKTVVVLWSTNSRNSDYVLEEAEYGKSHDILFPVFIEKVDPPFGFSRIQTADLTDWKNNTDFPGWVELRNSLRKHFDDSTFLTETNPTSESTLPNSSNTTPANTNNYRSSTEKAKISRKKVFLPMILILLGLAVFSVKEWINNIFFPSEESVRMAESSANETFQMVTSDEKDSPQINNSDTKTQETNIRSTSNMLFPELIYIPSGIFDMGEQDAVFIKNLDSNTEKFYGVPGIRIQINEPFYLSKTEITYEQYDYYIHERQRNGYEISSPETAEGGRGNQPVVNVNWTEAAAYAQWLGEQTNNQCRLPTEAEWEYAARAGTNTAYPWGDKIGINNANCDGCESQIDHDIAAPVGSYKENKFGLHDMSGNVWEWTCSTWREQFDGSEQQCNNNIEDTQPRVLRGGSWSDSPDFVRTASRYYYYNLPFYRNQYFGFRIMCSSPIE